MRLSKFLIFVVFLTFLSFLYVYQQTEIFRLAYMGQKKLGAFEELLDKNTILRYNIKRSTSLVHIGNEVSKDARFEIPVTYQLVRLESPKEIRVSENVPQRNILSRLFGIKREAQAKTINP